MKYTAHFADISNTKYQVVIETPASGEDKELTLAGDEPVQLEMSGDLYDTFRGESCTCTFLVDEVLADMYNNKADEVSLYVYDMTNAKTIFRGYVTPNEYDQEWKYMSKLEIEAVSADSKLQYLDFDISQSDGVQSFYTLLKRALVTKCGYEESNIFLTTSLGGVVSTGSNTAESSVMERLFISPVNFYDDDDDATPWKWDEVLEEILKFLNMSMTIFEDCVYIIDYDSFAHKNGDTYVCSMNTLNNTYKPVPEAVTLTADKFRGNATVSLDETYQKIEIENNAYEIEKIDLDVFEDPKLTAYINFDRALNACWTEKIKYTDEDGNVTWYDYKIYEAYYRTVTNDDGTIYDALQFYGAGTEVAINTSDEIIVWIVNSDTTYNYSDITSAKNPSLSSLGLTTDNGTKYTPIYGSSVNYYGFNNYTVSNNTDKSSISSGNSVKLTNFTSLNLFCSSSNTYKASTSSFTNKNLQYLYYDVNDQESGHQSATPCNSYPWYIYEYSVDEDGNAISNSYKLRAVVDMQDTVKTTYDYMYVLMDGIKSYNSCNTYVAVQPSNTYNVVNGYNAQAKVYKYAIEKTNTGEFTDSLDWSNTICLYTYIPQYANSSEFRSYYDNAFYHDFTNGSSLGTSSDDSYGMFRYKQLTLKTQKSYSLNSTVDSYLVINGSVCMSYAEYKSETLPGLECDQLKNTKGRTYNNTFCGFTGNDGTEYGYPCLRVELKIGDKYYKPSYPSMNTGTWTTTPTTFVIPIGKTDDMKGESFIDITNTVSWKMNLDGLSGFAVQIPANTSLYGAMELTFYTPYCVNYDLLPSKSVISSIIFTNSQTTLEWMADQTHYKNCGFPWYVLIKDLEIKYGNEVYTQVDTDYDDDIAYSNVIDEDYVGDFDTIKLKVNTQPVGKKNSYASVMRIDGNGDYPYLTTTYNVGTQTTQMQEYQIIQNRINHYSTPKYLFKAKLSNEYTPISRVLYPGLTDGTFVPIKQSINLKMKTTSITLAEV